MKQSDAIAVAERWRAHLAGYRVPMSAEQLERVLSGHKAAYVAGTIGLEQLERLVAIAYRAYFEARS